MKKTLLILILFLLVMPSCASAEDITIEDMQSSTVQLRGRLELKSFYGPPNYGETPDVDVREEYYFINLERAADVRENSGKVFKNVRSLQIVLTKGRRVSMEKIDTTKKVLVIGKLFLAETGHHHSDILIFAESISNIP